jgi:hypothetical protein
MRKPMELTRMMLSSKISAKLVQASKKASCNLSCFHAIICIKFMKTVSKALRICTEMMTLAMMMLTHVNRFCFILIFKNAIKKKS